MSNEPVPQPSLEAQLAETKQYASLFQNQRDQLSSKLHDMDARLAIALAKIQELSKPPAVPAP